MLVPASKQHDTRLMEQFDDFSLEDLRPYKPEYLSGFVAERYTVPLREGWSDAVSRMDDSLEDSIRRQIGGDELRNLSIDTQYSNGLTSISCCRFGMPLTCTRRRFIGIWETGSISGKVPRSGWKITFFTLFCVLVVTAIILYFYQS